MVAARTRVVAGLGVVIAALWAGPASPPSAAGEARPGTNLLVNGSFELGRDFWHLDQDGATVARFAVDDAEAGAGRTSARITIDKVQGWGTQFGQHLDAVPPGKTCTFAVLAKSMQGPVSVKLEIERRGKPYDRAAQSPESTITKDRWTELHVTFQVSKSFPQGWFAYVSCTQAGADYRLDAFRLYEGPYVPFQEAAREEQTAAAVHLFDTAAHASAPLAPAAIAARAGWTEVPEDETKHAFAGDAVLLNDRLALVLRSGGAGAELYVRGASDYRPRATLAPAGGAARIAGVKVIETGPSESTVEVAYQTSDGRTLGLRYELAAGQPFVKSEACQAGTALALAAPCRYLVLPDFFADDIVVDAAEIRQPTAELPCENFLIHLLPGGESLLMTVATARDEDVRIALAGEGERRVERSEIPYGKQGKVWVAAIEGRDVWHAHNIVKDDAGQTIALGWHAPYAAQWRVDWRQADTLTGSWEMVAQRADRRFEKIGWFGEADTLPPDRLRWTTVLGRFAYPCWIDQAGEGFLQPLKRSPVQFVGPALIYPINRVPHTPLDRFTVVDLVRGTLGVGPCEYILDLEGQSTAMRGRATCATRDALKEIYSAKQQRKRRAESERILDDVVIFVKHIRGRIEQYQAFARELLVYLQAQRQAHPELGPCIERMETLARVIPSHYERRKEHIRTPEYVVGLTEQFRRELLDYEGSDALAKCTVITHAIVDVGGNQDELVGECRMAVKALRQASGLLMASDPRAAPLAREIRGRTQQILRNPASYEAPRH